MVLFLLYCKVLKVHIQCHSQGASNDHIAVVFTPLHLGAN